MKKFTLITALVTILFTSCYTEKVKQVSTRLDRLIQEQSFIDSSKQTKISLSQYELEYGKVKIGTRITGEFYVKNIGNLPFKIAAIEARCHCTTIQIADDRNEIAVQDSLKVSFKMETKDKAKGNAVNAIQVVGNCPNGYEVFQMKGTLFNNN